MINEIWLAGGTRTPIGGFLGTLAEVPAPALGSVAIKESLHRAGVAADQVDEVILGNVVGSGPGAKRRPPGRHRRRAAGFGGGDDGQQGLRLRHESVMLAAQAIQCGDAQAVVAGGTENMSAAPYLLPKARAGYRLGHGEVLDAVIKDGLWDVYNNLHMGTCGDRCAAKEGISRQEQDDFAVASFQRAIKAQKEKLFAEELVAVEIKGRKGSVFVSEDETPGRFNEEKLRALRPAFDPAGSVTAGNASSINDAAAAIVVISPEKAKTLGVQPQAKILGYATYSREPEWFTLAPVCAIDRLMQKLGLSVAERRPVRSQRGLFRGYDRGHEAIEHSPREDERAWRRGGLGPSHRGQRHADPGDAAFRPEATAGEDRHRLALHRRRRGRGHGRGTALSIVDCANAQAISCDPMSCDRGVT